MPDAERDIIERLHEENADLLRLLEGRGEVSMRSSADEAFRKSLVLSAASYFEYRVVDVVRRFCSQLSRGSPELDALVRKKALSRQYHTLFAWDGRNANSFFALFGEDFKQRASEKVKASEGLTKAVRAFLELGSLRNQLVHLNYATFALEKTSDEVLATYVTAREFVAWLGQEMDDTATDFLATTSAAPGVGPSP